MQLIALKNISTQRPVGTIFEEVGTRARILVALGVAKPYEAPPVPPAPAVVAAVPVSPVAEPSEPEPAQPDDTQRPYVRRGRSFPIGHKPS